MSFGRDFKPSLERYVALDESMDGWLDQAMLLFGICAMLPSLVLLTLYVSLYFYHFLDLLRSRQWY